MTTMREKWLIDFEGSIKKRDEEFRNKIVSRVKCGLRLRYNFLNGDFDRLKNCSDNIVFKMVNEFYGIDNDSFNNECVTIDFGYWSAFSDEIVKEYIIEHEENSKLLTDEEIETKIIERFNEELSQDEDDLEAIFDSCVSLATTEYTRQQRLKHRGCMVSMDYTWIKKHTHEIIKNHLTNKTKNGN